MGIIGSANFASAHFIFIIILHILLLSQHKLVIDRTLKLGILFFALTALAIGLKFNQGLLLNHAARLQPQVKSRHLNYHAVTLN